MAIEFKPSWPDEELKVYFSRATGSDYASEPVRRLSPMTARHQRHALDVASEVVKLTPGEREALLWHEQGFSMALLARAKGTTRQATTQALKRALRQLAAALPSLN